MTTTTLPQTTAPTDIEAVDIVDDNTVGIKIVDGAARGTGGNSADTTANSVANTADKSTDGAVGGTPSIPVDPAPVAEPGDHTRAFTITSFVLGIASIVSGWTFIAPITGLVLGIIALRRNTADRGLALWGVWLNAAMLILSALMVIVLIAVFGFALLTTPFLAA